MGSPEIQNSHYSNEKIVHFPGATPDAVVDILQLTPEYLKSVREYFIDTHGQYKFESSLQSLLWDSREVISFDDFTEFSSIRNNFYLFFVESFVGEIMRSQQFYIDFRQKYPQLDSQLKEQFESGDVFDAQFQSQSHLVLLYEAYQRMIQLDSVDSNRAILQ